MSEMIEKIVAAFLIAVFVLCGQLGKDMQVNLQQLQKLCQQEALQRQVVQCRLESAIKMYEAELLDGNFVQAEALRNEIHTLTDVFLDSLNKVCISLRNVNGS